MVLSGFRNGTERGIFKFNLVNMDGDKKWLKIIT